MKAKALRSPTKLSASLLLAASLVGLAATAKAQYTGDFNGDGIATDVATVTATKVTVTHGGGVPTRTYNLPAGSFSTVVSQLDGAVGLEIAIVYLNNNIFIINDRLGTTRTTNLGTIGGGARSMVVGEMNGVAGNELVFIFANKVIEVIDDNAKVRREYSLSSTGTGGFTWFVSQLNAVAGQEIIFTFDNGYIGILEDKVHLIYSYNLPNFTIYGHPDSRVVSNVDGLAGNEIVYSKSTWSQKWRITHRTHSQNWFN